MYFNELGSFAHHGSFMMFFNELGSLLMVLKVHRFILGKMAIYEETNLLTPLVHNLHNFGKNKNTVQVCGYLNEFGLAHGQVCFSFWVVNFMMLTKVAINDRNI
jgi:hypothetical protein